MFQNNNKNSVVNMKPLVLYPFVLEKNKAVSTWNFHVTTFSLKLKYCCLQ